ncbi:alanyl-tRNA editing protein [Pseudomonas fragi]|uniref:alanyl-tRNA editing protein n=1 Tax=Pseudomonas fragi TaxID=296 RepID=UPI0021C11EE9|nr:alanyl-tRNA editing protein [Pseudomonas fragi]UXL39736.1 alanyl-tRNA editing protein [Pseudomonas fragi]
MTQRLFFTDDALIADINVISCTPHEDGFAVTVQATPFHPQGGGQPCDLGHIGYSEVVKVLQEQDAIVHYVKQVVALGPARAQVDAPRRHLNARLHSAGHLIGVVGEQAGWLPTKAHHWPGECRVSFTPGDDAQPLEALAIEQQLERWISADLPRQLNLDSQQRAISFGDLPGYPCGGTHVRSLGELQAVSVLSVTLKKGVLSVRYHLD